MTNGDHRSVGVNNLLAVFLQSPVEAGGYGFSPNQNAYCTYLHVNEETKELTR
jgi:hypothetical protein